MEWRNDGGMGDNLESRVLPCFKNNPSFHPHSVIPTSSLSDKTAQNAVKMGKMTLEWNLSIVIFHSCSFKHIRNEEGMTEWRGMREVLEGERKVNSEKPIILPSFYPFLRHLTLHNLPSQMSMEWQVKWASNNFNRVLPPLRRQHLIKVFWSSFHCHFNFIQNRYIISHLKWVWNDSQMSLK